MKLAASVGFIVIALTALTSCDTFERDFYNAIDEGQIRTIKNLNNEKFDLATITNFNWDSVLVIIGNESVPVTAEEIEISLHRRTTDLPTNKDRFYFLQHDKSIIVKEIDTRAFSNNAMYDIELCVTDSVNHRSWLARRECNFKLKSNSRTPGSGTVFLFPPCKTTVIPDSLKIFK